MRYFAVIENLQNVGGTDRSEPTLCGLNGADNRQSNEL